MKSYTLTLDEVSHIGPLLDPAKGHVYEHGTLYVPDEDECDIVDQAVASIADALARAAKDRLLAYAAEKRWRVETGGITAGGVMVATDDRSKSLVMGARMAADRDPNFTTRFKPVGGGFVTVDAPAIIAISDALLAHVAACFAIEAQVVADIDAGTITTTAEIDAADWPGS